MRNHDFVSDGFLTLIAACLLVITLLAWLWRASSPPKLLVTLKSRLRSIMYAKRGWTPSTAGGGNGGQPPQALPHRMPIRIIKHEAVPQTGSFEVRFPDGRPSVYFYWTTFRDAGLVLNRWTAIAPWRPPGPSREASGTKNDEIRH